MINILKKIFIYCALILNSFLGYSQHSNLPFEKGEQAYARADYDSASYYFIKAKRVFESNNNAEQLYNVSRALTQTYLRKNAFTEAEKELDYLNELIDHNHLESKTGELLNLKAQLKIKVGEINVAIALYDSIILLQPEMKEIAYAHIRKGLANIINNDNLQDAEKALQKAEILIKDNAISDESLLSDFHDLNGKIKWHTGEFEAALKQFKIVLSYKIGIHGESHPEVGAMYASIGIMYKNMLQYDKALEYYSLSLDLRKKFLGETHLQVSDSYNNIGYLLYKKDLFDEALDFHRKAFAIRSEQLPSNHNKVLQSVEHIGLCYGGKKEFREAEKQFKSLLNARIEKLGINNHWVGYAYYNLGAVAVEDKDYLKAIEYFQQATDIGKVVYGPYNYDQADNYNRLANCYLKLNETLKAQQNFHLAFQHNLPEYKWNGDLMTVPDMTYYLSFREGLRTLIGLANSFGLNSTVDEIMPALNYVKEGEKLIKTFKRSFSNDDLLTISSSSKELADCAVKIYDKLNQLDPKQLYKEEIFRYSELAKGSALLSKLSDEKAMRISDIPSDMLVNERRFKTEQDSLNNLILTQLKKDENSAKLDSAKTELFEVNRSYETFIESLESNYPKYAINKYGESPVMMNEVQQLLSSSERKTAIIQYHYSEDKMFVISVITSNEHRIVNSREVDLTPKIQAFREAIMNQENVTFLKDSYALYEILILPIQDMLVNNSDLVIIPDGVIGYIPFDILTSNPKSEDYLLFNYAISYDLSTTIFATRKDEVTQEKMSFLAYAPTFEQNENQKVSFGDINIVRADVLGPLPGAQDEAVSVSEIMKGDLRLGKNATESNFKTEAINYTILHLATHSIINQKDPNYSKLLFSKGNNDEDGELHAYELENMDLKANLVTLSACNTGFGKINEGEGVMSMARAFRSAGVTSVVMSLWPTSDKSTPKLMNYFYQNLADGQPKNVALNNARKQYLSNAKGKARHPFYWGGFVIIGDNSPIITDSLNLTILVSLGILLLILMARILLRKKFSSAK